MSVSNTERKDVILNEVRRSYEIQFDLKRNLESKATNAITVSGIIITLLFGFSTFLIKGPIQIEWLQYYYVTILVSIVLSIIALLYALHSLRITKYCYVLIDSYVNGPKLQEVVDDFMMPDNDHGLDDLIYSYVAAIKINSFQNDLNAGYVSRSQTFLLTAIIFIGIAVGLVAFPYILKIFNH
jgi:hypothetical protein